MKKTLFLAMITAAFTAINAKAQLVNDSEGWRRFEASYVTNMYNQKIQLGYTDIPTSPIEYDAIYNFDTYEDSEMSVLTFGIFEADAEIKSRGFELGYVQGINLTTRVPIFLELGGKLTWSHSSKAKANNIKLIVATTGPSVTLSEYTRNGSYEVDAKTTFMSIAIPANIAYKFAFVNSGVTMVPYVGPNFKFNLIGKGKVEFGDEEIKTSFFDKDEMGGSDNTARRFQIGLNLGVGVNLSKVLYVGYCFQPDFTHYFDIDDCKTRSNYITVGINF